VFVADSLSVTSTESYLHPSRHPITMITDLNHLSDTCRIERREKRVGHLTSWGTSSSD
jgi:hypothetical protein